MTDALTSRQDAPPLADAGWMRAREIVFLLAWPWLLVGVLAVAATGASEETTGGAAAALLGAGVTFLALVGAPVLSGMRRPGASERAGGTSGSVSAVLSAAPSTARTVISAALAGALALPALVASALVSPVGSGTVVCGTVVIALATYALAQAVAVLGRWYPLAAVLWLGGPPLLYLVLMDVLGRRAEWLLVLGPASGAAWMVAGPGSAWGRLAGPALVLVLAGGALSVLAGAATPHGQRTRLRDDSRRP